MTVPAITLTKALTTPELFGKVFAAPSFWTWRTIGKLVDGLPLTEPRERELFEQCTGYAYSPGAAALHRIILLAGRRAGKDRFLSAVAVWRAALACDWRKYQSPGEGAVVLLLGADKKQSAILRKYCQGLLQAPMLAREVTRSTGETTEFRNGASLEIATNDARLVRGRSAIAVLGSECCHWKTDEFAASSDEEVVSAAEPSMAMTHDGGLMIFGSSVHRKRGYMHRKFTELFGQPHGDFICWFATSQTMNPKLPQHVIDHALAENPSKAKAEFLNIWREDLSDFLPADVVDACTDFDVYERPPQPGVRYEAFTDAASGTGSDSFALTVVHRDRSGAPIVDAIRARKPRFIPSEVIGEFAELLHTYGIHEVRGDRYATGFHSSLWRAVGFRFLESERSTSENFLAALPHLLSRKARLINNATLRSELTALECTVGAGDKETIGHPKHSGAHDDIAAATCGAIAYAAGKPRGWSSLPAETRKSIARWASIPARANRLDGYFSGRARLDNVGVSAGDTAMLQSRMLPGFADQPPLLDHEPEPPPVTDEDRIAGARDPNAMRELLRLHKKAYGVDE